MYVPFQDARFVPVKFAAGEYVRGAVSMPKLDAMAARDAQGHLWLSLVNIDPEAPASIHLSGYKSASGDVLTAPKVDSVNTFDAPAIVAPKPVSVKGKAGGLTLELPARSVTVVRLD